MRWCAVVMDRSIRANGVAPEISMYLGRQYMYIFSGMMHVSGLLAVEMPKSQLETAFALVRPGLYFAVAFV